jgi:hypothetical protein
MAQEIANLTIILIELNKAVKMLNFYPTGHPNLDTALGKCYQLIRKQLEEAGDIKYRVDQKGFYYDNAPVGAGSPDIVILAKKLFFRRVKELLITQRVTQAELKNFLHILKVEPEEISSMGGLEKFLAEKDITGILLNEMRYEDIKKIKKELEKRVLLCANCHTIRHSTKDGERFIKEALNYKGRILNF